MADVCACFLAVFSGLMRKLVEPAFLVGDGGFASFTRPNVKNVASGVARSVASAGSLHPAQVITTLTWMAATNYSGEKHR